MKMSIKDMFKNMGFIEKIFETPLHPLFFVLYPAFALASANSDQIQFSETYRSLIVSVALCVVVLVVLKLVDSSWHRVSLFASIFFILIFSYGHTYSVLEPISIGSVQVGRHRHLLPAWISILILVGIAIRNSNSFAKKICIPMNLIGLTACLIAIIPMMNDALIRGNVHQEELSRDARNNIGTFQKTQRLNPDIYYIVTDSYAREDVLRNSFSFDNSEFIDFLKTNGFYVADKSNANFLFTHLSLSSSLNLDYIQEIAPNYRQGSVLPIQNNLVREVLEANGYKTVGLSTGWDATEWFDADIILTPDMGQFELINQTSGINAYESILLESTVFLAIIDLDVIRSTPLSQFVQERMQDPFNIQREIVLSEFRYLEDVIPNIEGPKFVFAHILPPHGPHVFDATGEPIAQEGAFTLASEQFDSFDDDEAYLDALKYVNIRLESALTSIINNSNRPLIIILQSDHGPSKNLDWNNPSNSGLQNKMSILNAYYLPEECKGQLYDSITPVNSFRVIFNCEFGTNLSILPDQTYYGYDTYVPIEELFNNDQ